MIKRENLQKYYISFLLEELINIVGPLVFIQETSVRTKLKLLDTLVLNSNERVMRTNEAAAYHFLPINSAHKTCLRQMQLVSGSVTTLFYIEQRL